ncbi:hypothetical protein OIU77_004543 [Salix suchowensis]|uniref:Uncharacterized protein n=1 Tax=Salix suchowensis TaxID=1278906 RepID=A0ABQ9AWT0_9ROSI|nr:hypothetical protein OIU77_004543 [Salix suchowensis]
MGFSLKPRAKQAVLLHQQQRVVVHGTRWGPVSKGSAAAHRALASNSSPPPSIFANQPLQSTFLQSESPMTSAVSSKQTAISCLPVDIEWPPPTSSTSSLNDITTQSQQISHPYLVPARMSRLHQNLLHPRQLPWVEEEEEGGVAHQS